MSVLLLVTYTSQQFVRLSSHSLQAIMRITCASVKTFDLRSVVNFLTAAAHYLQKMGPIAYNL